MPPRELSPPVKPARRHSGRTLVALAFDVGLLPLSRVGKPSRPTLPPATYYLGGVNSGQRAVYDSHCSERYAARSPYHYSSRDEVAGQP